MGLISKLKDKFFKLGENYKKTTLFMDNIETGITRKLYKEIRKITYRAVNDNEILENKKCENLAHVAVARYQAFDELYNLKEGIMGAEGGRDDNVDKLKINRIYGGFEKHHKLRKLRKLESNLNANYMEITKGDLEGRSAYNTLKEDLKRFGDDYSSEIVDKSRKLLVELEKSLEGMTAGYEVADFQGQEVLKSKTGSRIIGGGDI